MRRLQDCPSVFGHATVLDASFRLLSIMFELGQFRICLTLLVQCTESHVVRGNVSSKQLSIKPQTKPAGHGDMQVPDQST